MKALFKSNVLTGVLVISMVGSTLPIVAAEAESGLTAAASVQTTVPATFRASLDHAAAYLAASLAAIPVEPARALRAPAKRAGDVRGQATGVAGGGGGMSKVALVTTLLGTVAGIGGTYYMLKQLKKTESSISNIPSH
jgi:hypothetical protein